MGVFGFVFIILLGEILGLCWDCVNFDEGTILVKSQLQRDYANGNYIFVSPKNNKSRIIKIAPFVVNVLHEHKREQKKLRLKAGPAWINSNLVFTNALGEHLKHVTVYNHYKRIVKKIGISKARFHDLRHSYAVAALQAGDDIKTVQENLGHHTAAFTLDVYGHVTDKMRKESADRMEAFIQSIKNCKG